ncbi:MAG: hypothetical protein WA726_05195 [Acidimicrobiia bacterium]
MSGKLLERLQDIPGVAAVSFDLDDVESGINVRLEPDANEVEVLERVKALLVAYGVRSHDDPDLRVGGSRLQPAGPLGVEVRITPIKGGARVEVIGKAIRSFRVVMPDPMSVAQGLADAWCQVIGKPPFEITRAKVRDDGVIEVAAVDGDFERVGRADTSQGWELALGLAVGKAMGLIELNLDPEDADLAHAGW